MVDHSATDSSPAELRVAQIARAFGVTPEMWTGRVPERLGGVELTADDVAAVSAVGRLATDVVASKFDCLLSSTYDSASITGLNDDLSSKYLSDDPAVAFDLGTAYVEGAVGRFGLSTDRGGYTFFDYEDFQTLQLEEEEPFVEEEIRDEVSRRRRQSMFQRRAAQRRVSRPGRRSAASPRRRPQSSSRPLDRAVASPYPSTMGRAGATLTPRAIRRPAQQVLQASASERTARAQRFAQAAAQSSSQLGGTSLSWTGATFEPSLVDTTHVDGGLSAAGLDTLALASPPTAETVAVPFEAAQRDLEFGNRTVEQSPARGAVLLDGLALSRQHLPGLTGAVEIAHAAFGSARNSADARPSHAPASKSAPRIGGVFSPQRLESALKVVTLDPEQAAVSALAMEMDVVPGYHRLMYDAVEQTWVAAEPAEAPGFDDVGFDAAEANSVPRARGRRLSRTAAEAARMAAVMSPVTRAADIAHRAAPGSPTERTSPLVRTTDEVVRAGSRPFADTAPLAAPVVANAADAQALAAEVARFAARPSHVAAQRMRETRSAERTSAARTQASLRTLVPEAARTARITRERARATHAAFSAERAPTVGLAAGASAAPTTASLGVAGVGGATTTRAELFAAQQMRRSDSDVAQLVRPDEGATSIAGEVRYAMGSWGGSPDDPSIYVALQADTPTPPGLRRPMGSIRRGTSAWDRTVSMPLSSASALQAGARTPRGQFDASTAVSAASPVSAKGTRFEGLTLRSGDTVARSAAGALRGAARAGTVFDMGETPGLATTPISLPSLSAAGLSEAAGYYYDMSYDVDAVLLDRDIDISIGGAHVEVRGGRIRQARPANATASTPNRPQSQTRVEEQLTQRALLPETHRRLARLKAASAAQQTVAATDTTAVGPAAIRSSGPQSPGALGAAEAHVRTAGRRALSAGHSAIERGFPALSLSPTTPTQSGVAIDALPPAAAALLAGVSESELAMMPPAARETLRRQLTNAASMTGAGAATGGLVERLARLSDPGAGDTRHRLLRELSMLGIDTPELLAALDEGGGLSAEVRTEASAPFRRRDASMFATQETTLANVAEAMALTSGTDEAADAPLARADARLAQAERVDRAMAHIAETLTGVGGTAAAENLVERHAYFGDFAPATIHRTKAADLLKHLLTQRTTGRPSALAYGAEMGELMTIGEQGVGSRSLAQAVAAGKRKTSTGAPSQAARIARTEQESRRRLTRLRSEEAALAERVGRQAPAASPAAAPGDVAGTLATASADTERFADRVAGAVAQSLSGGTSVSVDAGRFGWDSETLTLTAVADGEGAEPTFSDRVSRSFSPWTATAALAGTTAMSSASSTGTGGLRSLGYDSEAHPLIAAIREPDTAAPDSTAPLGSSRVADIPALAQALRQASDGVRGFASLGREAISTALQRLVMRRMPGGSLPGNLELAHSVLDRANGSFAGLDAGILEFLQSTAARAVDSEPRELRPGLDDWPEDSLEVLRQHGWGLDSGPSEAASTDTSRVRRLERRVEAAQEAYTRLEQARTQAQATAPRTMDSVDWNLVQTGAARNTPDSADLGRLGATMVRSQSVPDADMSFVAPAVKMVAQQAQLKPTSEPVQRGQAPAPSSAGRKKKKKAKKVDIESLARQIARRISRRNELERDRFGRS